MHNTIKDRIYSGIRETCAALCTYGEYSIAPPVCAYCKIFLNERTWLCGICKQLIIPIASVAMPLTTRYTVRVVALSGYQDPLKHLILAKGWSDMTSSRVLAELLWQMDSVKNISVDYWVPIPLHWMRQARRGFNQAEIMAGVLSHHSKKPVKKLLKRSKRTLFQASLAPANRTANLHQAFTPVADNVTDYYRKHLVLVDDLMTTGATLQEAAGQLLVYKPASISAVVACRVITV